MSRPSPANALLALAVVALALLEYVYGVRDVALQRADFGISAGVAAVVSLLSGLFNRFSGKSTDLGAKQAIEGVRADVSSLGKTLTSMIVAVAGQLASVLGVVRRFLQRVFSKLYDMLAALVTRIARILDKIFGPIIAFLDKVKFHLKTIYDKVIRPIIDTIEFVRAVLRLLSFAGIDWAKKLDQQLLKLEQYVLAPYEFLVQQLNEVRNWINRIVTLDGLLQRVTLLQSLLRDVSYTNNLWWNSQSKKLSSDEISRSRGVDGGMTEDAIDSAARAYLLSGSGPFAPAADEWAADARRRLRVR